jgi:tight adherence protein B
MLLIGFITFALVLALILGIFWAFVLRPEAKAQAALHQRMTPKPVAKKRKLVVEPGPGRADQAVEAFGARLLGVPLKPVRRLLERAGLQLSVAAFVLLCAWIGGMACLILWAVTRRFDVSLLVGPWAAGIPYAYVRWVGDKRMWRFEEQFPEAIDLIARALRAGHALPTALGMVASEVPNPVGGEFKKLYDQQNFGMSLPDALRAFAARVPVLDARFFVTAVLTQRESGGNLSGVLDNLASVIRERFKVKRQVKVISAHGRMTAVILSGLPPALAMMLTFLAPQNMMLLVQDELGIKMIMGAAILQIIGTLVMRKIVNVEF